MQTVPCNRRWQAAMQHVIQEAGTDKYEQELVQGLCALLLADRTKVPDVKEALSPRKLHPVFDLKGGICVQKKRRQFLRVST